LADTQADGFFTTSTLEEFASESQRAIAVRLRPDLLPELHTIDTGTIQAGSYFAVTSDMAQFVGLTVYNATNEDAEVGFVPDVGSYKRITQNEFYAASAKQPMAYLEAGNFYIEPDRAGDTFKLRYVKSRYVKSPTDITGTTEMTLHDRWEDLALDYAEYLSQTIYPDAPRAMALYQRFQERVNALNMRSDDWRGGGA
jgi:hypothetical protein